MYETTVFFGGTLSGALQGFCSSVMMFGKDTVHAERLSEAIKEQYRGGFLISMRVYCMMDFLLNMAAKSVVARDFKEAMLIPLKGEYLLQWVEQDFQVALSVPRSPGKLFRLFVCASDTRTVRGCADRFGIKECKVEISPDTLLTLEEFGRINWNETARGVKVPYSEWLTLLRKYLKK
jgi:hypothetical protein